MTTGWTAIPSGARAVIDRALDLAVVPGFGAPGYELRSAEWGSAADPARIAGADVLVTGASSGIGEAASVELASHGARVHMVARDRERLERAAARVRGRLGHAEGAIETWTCDLSDLDSVRAFAAAFRDGEPELCGVIHNAGVLVDERRRSDQGHELTFATHVLGPLLLSGLLAPELRGAAPSRVVFVSSGGMYTARLHADDLELEREEFDGPRFYAHAKRLQVIVAEQLASRWRGDAVAVFSMHPGWVRTGGLTEALPRFARLMDPVLREPAAGADTAVWLVGSRDAPSGPSGFWHDRRPRAAHRLPWTREAPADRERVWAELVRASGFDDGRPA